eukprot:825-Heterococcus_DN1.PRE.1
MEIAEIDSNSSSQALAAITAVIIHIFVYSWLMMSIERQWDSRYYIAQLESYVHSSTLELSCRLKLVAFAVCCCVKGLNSERVIDGTAMLSTSTFAAVLLLVLPPSIVQAFAISLAACPEGFSLQQAVVCATVQ